MYRIRYYLTNCSIVEVEDEYSKEGMEQFIIETRNNIITGGVVQAETQTDAGCPKTIIINTKNITKVECVNLDDKVTEE